MALFKSLLQKIESKEFQENLTIINFQLFPFLVVVTFAFLFIETYTYVGFISKYLIGNSRIFLFFTFLSGLLLILTPKRKKIERMIPLYDFLFKVNLLLFPVFCVLFYLFNAVEATHYLNYVYSKFHLQPQNYSPIVALSFYLILLQFWPILLKKLGLYDALLIETSNTKVVNFIKKSHFKRLDIIKIFFILLISSLLLLYTFQQNMVKTYLLAVRDAFLEVKNWNLSYDDRMAKNWGLVYHYLTFVRQNSEANSTILIPPQDGPWLSTGNEGLVRYFLYPRKVINGKIDKIDNYSFDYVFIAKGEWSVPETWRYGWPKVPLKAEKILYLDINTLMINEVFTDYDPDNPKNKEAWGLIKIHKEKKGV